MGQDTEVARARFRPSGHLVPAPGRWPRALIPMMHGTAISGAEGQLSPVPAPCVSSEGPCGRPTRQESCSGPLPHPSSCASSFPGLQEPGLAAHCSSALPFSCFLSICPVREL